MQRKALFVGINDYEGGLTPLSCACNDANDLCDYFRDQLGYDTYVLRNADILKIRKKITEVTAELQKGDVFLFFFAGHGFTVDKGENNDRRLATARDLKDHLEEGEGGISLRRLKKLTKGGYSRVFILDACQTKIDTTNKTRSVGNLEQEKFKRRDLSIISSIVGAKNDVEDVAPLLVINSCNVGDVAYELERNGLFTWAFLKMLSKMKDNGEAPVFNAKLVEYIAEQMQSHPGRFRQTPVFFTSDETIPEISVFSEPSVDSLETATSALVMCPICGKKNHPENTFRCCECGRDNLCLRHQNEKTFLCFDCAAKKEREESERKVAEQRMGEAREEVASGGREEVARKEGEATPGKIYLGTVTGTKEFGVFVQILPGIDGFCHISELHNKRVSSVEFVCKTGDKIFVKCLKVDEQGFVKLSRCEAMKEIDAVVRAGNQDLNRTIQVSDGGESNERQGIAACMLGEFLRSARLAKGDSVEKVAQKTHMLDLIVRELENGDYHRIPAPIYGRGLIRLYAVYVGLDPRPLVKIFQEEYERKRREASLRNGTCLETGICRTITLPGGATMEMIYCPPGEFMMGSPEGEEGRFNIEVLHRVKLTKGFWLGKYPVTQGQWQSVMERNPSRFRGDADLPVEKVSWNDCRDFIDKVKSLAIQQLGGEARFPTEAEWEYACRAGTTTAYFWGNVLNGDRANCAGNGPCGTDKKGPNLKKTTPVGRYGANPWGFADMHGNVCEWCADWYGDYSGDAVDPTGPTSGDCRVQRGGGWYNFARGCRSACRRGEKPGYRRSSYSGFRLCFSVGQTFRCRVCGRDYLCTAHFDKQERCCEDCAAAKRRAREEERKAREEAERRLREEAERKAREEAERNARKAREEEERKIRERSERNWREEGGLKAGTATTITLPGGVSLEMIYCPPGEFMMGSPTTEEGREDNETQHRVMLTKGFWLGKYPITQRQWKSVMGNNPSCFKNTFWSRGDLPVEKVSWYDCKDFIDKVKSSAKQQLGGEARLPTEAEWEYACRAGTTTAYFWGNALNGDKANCNGNYPCGTKTKGPHLEKTTPVGRYAPNPWGFYEMHGNVWEWCADWFGDYSGDAVDPTGPSAGVRRVLRGGSWYIYARDCRSTNRYWCNPGDRLSDCGFRLCCSAGLRG